MPLRLLAHEIEDVRDAVLDSIRGCSDTYTCPDCDADVEVDSISNVTILAHSIPPLVDRILAIVHNAVHRGMAEAQASPPSATARSTPDDTPPSRP